MKEFKKSMDVQNPEVANEALDFSEMADVCGGTDQDLIVGKSLGFGCKCEIPPTKPTE